MHVSSKFNSNSPKFDSFSIHTLPCHKFYFQMLSLFMGNYLALQENFRIVFVLLIIKSLS
jgi:hypothetical protein